MNFVIQDLTDRNKQNLFIYKPVFYHLSSPEDKARFTELITANKNLLVHDEILSQTEELVKSLNPRIVFTKPELTRAALNFIGDTPHEEFGVWVYYPWSNRLVHLLKEEDFITVRTNRNQYKITPEEKAILATKKIGILGLSVGQSIALTLAMERSFGELRIADFDILELSNLNRIRTGVHNMGIPKTVAVAREIAEIDPYLKVTCYHEGATEENMDEFITAGGKLDILVDECDGLAIKILCRQKAKAHGIPVIMDTADRGMLDVERFDLEPDRSILHGFIDHLDINKVKEAKTNEQKVPYLLPILGIDTISTRMKASMLEIEQTITTWPQLASSVVLGGGMGADVCRRILLDQFHESGRYYVDIEEIIGDKNKKPVETKPLTIYPTLSKETMMGLIKTYNAKTIAGQLNPNQDIIVELVTAATMSTSGANGQAWKWTYHEGNLYLFIDGQYIPALLDTDNTTTLIGLGAATENLVLKAHALNLEVVADYPELDRNSKLIAVFSFFDQLNPSISTMAEPHVCDDLEKIIPLRHTNRLIGTRQEIDEAKYDYLRKIAQTIPGGNLKIISDKAKLEALAEIVAKMDRIRIMHEGGHMDFRAEMRWSKEEVEMSRNGIDLLGTVDLTSSELVGLRICREWPVIKYLNDWKGGTGLEKVGRKTVKAASALGLITMPEFSCTDFYRGGRVLERVWLAANKENISVHPISLSNLIFNTMMYGPKDILKGDMKKEVENLNREFEKLFEIDSQTGKVLLLRFFISEPPKTRSLRYPLENVLTFA